MAPGGIGQPYFPPAQVGCPEKWNTKRFIPNQKNNWQLTNHMPISREMLCITESILLHIAQYNVC